MDVTKIYTHILGILLVNSKILGEYMFSHKFTKCSFRSD